MPGNPDAPIDTSGYLPDWALQLYAGLQTTLAHGLLSYGYLHMSPDLASRVAQEVIQYLVGRGALHAPRD